MTLLGNADPARTFAVVVGVEQHRFGPGWDLDGPAIDALRFARWLNARGVPPGNLFAFVSPLATNAREVGDGFERLGCKPHVPTIDTIKSVFSETLAGKSGDLLLVVWGGHGVTSQRGSDRRLILSDATVRDRRNLRFDSLLQALRTKAFDGFKRQLFIVDACANYLENLQWKVDMPGEEISGDTELAQNVLQCALYAAASGQEAKNANVRRTGEFSEAVLAWLNEQPDFPGDVGRLNDCIKAHFEKRNAGGIGRQQPVHYIWNGIYPGGGEERSGEIPRERELQDAARASNLSIEQLRAIGDGIAGLPSMRERANRDRLVHALGPPVRTRILQRSDDPAFDLLNIAAAAFSNGIDAALFDALAFIEPNRIGIEREREHAERLLFAMTAFAALDDCGITPARYYQLYMRSAGNVQTAVDVSHDLDALLTRLADMAPNADGTRPLVEFMLRVAGDVPAHGPITVWIRMNVSSGERAAANALIARKGEIEQRTQPYLAVLVQTVGLKAGETPHIESWLWRGETVEIQRELRDCTADDESVRTTFFAILDEARALCGTALAVEFLVPREQFALAPERWELPPDGFSPTATVGDDHFVALRWRERYIDPKNAQVVNWINRMDAIEKRRNLRLAASMLWVSPEDYDFHSLRSRLGPHVDDADVVGLAFVPPALPNRQAGDLLNAALLSGAPFIFIPREERGQWNELRAELMDSLRAGIDVLPLTLAQRRAKASGEKTPTAVVWDRPDHIPNRKTKLTQPPSTP